MQLPGNEHIRERLRANELRCRERRKAEAVAQVEMVNQLTKENRELNARLQTLEIENRILRMSADSRLASAQVASDKPPRKAGDLWNPALD